MALTGARVWTLTWLIKFEIKTSKWNAEAMRPKTPSNPPQITDKCKVIMWNLP